METLKFKTRYKSGQPRKWAFKTTGPSLTQQQFKEECDVNNILAKYRKTGMITHISRNQMNYGDFASVEDYQTSLDKIMRAHESFLTLPSELRAKFENDPSKLIDYLQDSKNDEEAIKFGLKTRKTIEPTLTQQMETALDNHAKKQVKS